MDIGLEVDKLLEARPKAAPDASLPDLYVGGTFIEGEVRQELVELEVTAVRELLEADLIRLQAAQADRTSGVRDICPLELRTRHHEIARQMVMGHKQCDIAKYLGYTETTISLLKHSKAFQQLLLHYTKMRNEIITDPRALMQTQALENLEILRERVVSTEQGDEHLKVGFSTLASHTMNMLDRSGYGPSRTERKEHVFLTEEDMRAIKEVEAEFEVIQENALPTPVGDSVPGAQTGEPPAEVSRG